MSQAQKIRRDAELCLDIAERLKKARFFAVMEDGAPFEISVASLKPPFQMRQIKRKALLELLLVRD